MESSFDVYFDYIFMGGPDNKILVATMIYDSEGDILLAESQERKGVGPQVKHNLEHAILAFDYAITLVKQNYLESVVFKNQNKLVFTWILQENSKRKGVKQARDKLVSYLTLEGLEADARFEEVTGKDNPVKKYFKKKVGTVKAAKDSGSFNELLKTSTTSPVVTPSKGNVTQNIVIGTADTPSTSKKVFYKSKTRKYTSN